MTPAVQAAKRAGIAFEIVAYEHDAARGEGYGEAAARMLGQPPEQVFKTLLAEVVGRGLTVAIVPVAARLDLKAMAGAAHGKRASLADPAVAERATGYVVGAISPLGQKRRLPTVIDASARGFDRVYVSGGKRGVEIALAPQDLARLCDATFAEIAR